MRLVLILLLLTTFISHAQKDSLQLDLSTFGEFYYQYNPSRPASHSRQVVAYNHARLQEFSINLLLLQAQLKGNLWRVRLSPMLGSYVDYNLASEPAGLRYLYAANFGFALHSKKRWWLEGGILPSHIGLESAMSYQAITMTRSLTAEYSPYYETGIKLSRTSENEKLYFAILALNGWQKIALPEAYTIPAGGTQLTYLPSVNFSINYSTFVGSDRPDSVHALRFFQDVGISASPLPWLKVQGTFDVGVEQDSSNHRWTTAALLVKLFPDKKVSTGLRYEWIEDKDGVVFYGRNVKGLSANADVRFGKFMWRNEIRWLTSRDKIFLRGTHTHHDDLVIGTSICWYID